MRAAREKASHHSCHSSRHTEEHKLHRELCTKDDEISSLQQHVAELASANARLHRHRTPSSDPKKPSAAVTSLKRLIGQWFEDFRMNTNPKRTDLIQSTEGEAATSYFQALIAALVSVLQVAQEDVQALSPPPAYTDMLRRAIYAAQMQMQQTSEVFHVAPVSAAPAVGGSAASAAGSSSSSAAATSAPQQEVHRSHPQGSAALGAPPPMLQALGDRPLPRREEGASSVWGFLFGAAEGGFAVSDINKSESTHVLPV